MLGVVSESDALFSEPGHVREVFVCEDTQLFINSIKRTHNDVYKNGTLYYLHPLQSHRVLLNQPGRAHHERPESYISTCVYHSPPLKPSTALEQSLLLLGHQEASVVGREAVWVRE